MLPSEHNFLHLVPSAPEWQQTGGEEGRCLELHCSEARRRLLSSGLHHHQHLLASKKKAWCPVPGVTVNSSAQRSRFPPSTWRPSRDESIHPKLVRDDPNVLEPEAISQERCAVRARRRYRRRRPTLTDAQAGVAQSDCISAFRASSQAHRSRGRKRQATCARRDGWRAPGHAPCTSFSWPHAFVSRPTNPPGLSAAGAGKRIGERPPRVLDSEAYSRPDVQQSGCGPDGQRPIARGCR